MFFVLLRMWNVLCVWWSQLTYSMINKSYVQFQFLCLYAIKPCPWMILCNWNYLSNKIISFWKNIFNFVSVIRIYRLGDLRSVYGSMTTVGIHAPIHLQVRTGHIGRGWHRARRPKPAKLHICLTVSSEWNMQEFWFLCTKSVSSSEQSPWFQF